MNRKPFLVVVVVSKEEKESHIRKEIQHNQERERSVQFKKGGRKKIDKSVAIKERRER